jgi:PAS domain S-box-containing protein
MSFVTLIGAAGGQAAFSSLASAHMPLWQCCIPALGVPVLITFACVVVGLRR